MVIICAHGHQCQPGERGHRRREREHPGGDQPGEPGDHRRRQRVRGQARSNVAPHVLTVQRGHRPEPGRYRVPKLVWLFARELAAG